ncbi:PAS domain S-box protein, partial [bacterium]|nr:PAS domain S-box protein [bacterium]
ASDGLKAVQMLREELPIDLVITDLNMPGISGIDVIDILEKQYPEIQIIVVTGYGTMDTVLKALRCGAVDFLQKPFMLEVLKTSLQKADTRFQQVASARSQSQADAASPGALLSGWGLAAVFNGAGDIKSITPALRSLLGDETGNLFTSLLPRDQDWLELLEDHQSGTLMARTIEDPEAENLLCSYQYHPDQELYSTWITPLDSCQPLTDAAIPGVESTGERQRKLMLHVDDSYRIRFISPQTARLIGHQPAEIIGQLLPQVLGPLAKPLTEIDIREQLEETLHARITFPDEYTFWADIIFHATEDNGIFICEIDDVSYRKDLEAEIERQRNELSFTRQKLSMIVDTTTLMQEEATTHDKLEVIVEKIVQSHSFQRAAILLIDDKSVRDRYYAGFTGKSLDALLANLDLQSLLHYTDIDGDQKDAFVIHEVSGFVEMAGFDWTDQHHLLLPVRQPNKTAGFLLLDQPRERLLPDSVVIGLLSLFAGQIAAYLEEVELRQELLLTEQNYRNLFDNSRLAIILADAKDGRIVDINQHTLELFGYKRERLLDMLIWELRPDDYRETAQRNFQEAVKAGYGKYGNIPILRSDGGKILVEYDALVTQFQGRPVLQSYYRDITERQRMEFSVIQSQKLAGLGQLSAGVAHELRNPLGIINSSLYYINSCVERDELSFNDSIRKHLGIIKAEVERSRRIIENLLSFSRISKAEVEPVHINQLLQNTLDLVQKELLVNDITLETSFAQLTPLMLNLDQLKQAFLNIILNSTQAMPSGGTLQVSTSILENMIIIRFSDTGVGIPADQISDVLNPFFTTKSPGEGTGLGLSLTHSIIQRTGGSLHVESELEKGTSVTVKIPVK